MNECMYSWSNHVQSLLTIGVKEPTERKKYFRPSRLASYFLPRNNRGYKSESQQKRPSRQSVCLPACLAWTEEAFVRPSVRPSVCLLFVFHSSVCRFSVWEGGKQFQPSCSSSTVRINVDSNIFRLDRREKRGEKRTLFYPCFLSHCFILSK